MKQRCSRLLAACTALASGAVWGAAYEKVTLWSGEYATAAGAATSVVDDSQAVYYNPAGLAGSGREVSFNFSPTFSSFDGPFFGHSGQASGETEFRPVFGLTAAQPVSERLTLGVGAYASGGTNATFENLDLGSVDGYRPDAVSEISIVELAVAAGYQVTERLRVGAAWRASIVDAELRSPTVLGMTPGGPLVGEVAITELSDEDYGGFKLGAQYTAERWGVGLNYRSGVDFDVDGDAEIKSGMGTLFQGDASIESSFPEQWAVGGHYDFTPMLRGVAEFVWTHYEEVDGLLIDSDIPLINGLEIPQRWDDQENYKVGLIIGPDSDWTYRVGYAYTTQVTPDAFARATFASPGPGHTFTYGVQKRVDDHWDVAAGVEYSYAEGEVAVGEGANPVRDVGFPGDYESDAWVLHLGLTYHL